MVEERQKGAPEGVDLELWLAKATSSACKFLPFGADQTCGMPIAFPDGKPVCAKHAGILVDLLSRTSWDNGSQPADSKCPGCGKPYPKVCVTKLGRSLKPHQQKGTVNWCTACFRAQLCGGIEVEIGTTTSGPVRIK